MSLGQFLVMGLLLGEAAASDVHPSEQDGPSTRSSSNSPKELNSQECHAQQGSLAAEAFSRMEPEGPFSVWDITQSITWAPAIQGLRRVVVYYSIHAQNPSATHLLLQVELTHSLASAARHMTRAALQLGNDESWLLVWQAPDPSEGVLRLLMQGTANLQKLQESPHQLILSRGEGGVERFAVFENIMLR